MSRAGVLLLLVSIIGGCAQEDRSDDLTLEPSSDEVHVALERTERGIRGNVRIAGVVSPNARLWVQELTAEGRLLPTVRESTTDSEGAFEAEISAGMFAVTMAIPETAYVLFAERMRSLPVARTFDSETGALELSFPLRRAAEGRVPVLVRDGALDLASDLPVRWPMEVERSPDSMTIRGGGFVPGEYQLCLVAADSLESPSAGWACDSDTLEPGGTLALRVPTAEAQ